VVRFLSPLKENLTMKILNLCFSATGNTTKIAAQIDETARSEGHHVTSMKMTEDLEVDVLDYDFVFAGSGVYEWLPGKPVQELFARLRNEYAQKGLIKPSAPRIPEKKAVIYCSYGGVHTGVNEALPAGKYMGQLFDHLGFLLLGEWYILGEYHPEKLKDFSVNGRMGNISGRPNEADLKDVAEMVRGILVV
jgi:flavodoxin